MPMLLMFEAASEGDEGKTEAYASVFVEHAGKLVEVIIIFIIIAILIISMSDGLLKTTIVCQRHDNIILIQLLYLGVLESLSPQIMPKI